MSDNLDVFDLTELKRFFKSWFLGMALLIAIAYVAARYFMSYNLAFLDGKALSWAFLVLIIVGSIIYGRYYNRELKRILGLESFNEKIQPYTTLYKRKILWNCLWLLFSVGFLILTRKSSYLYLSIFQLVVMIPLFPNKLFIGKELKQDDIIYT